ncbi:hypothetical protein GN956_G11561 [Arapaima gigas]
MHFVLKAKSVGGFRSGTWRNVLGECDSCFVQAFNPHIRADKGRFSSHGGRRTDGQTDDTQEKPKVSRGGRLLAQLHPGGAASVTDDGWRSYPVPGGKVRRGKR